MAEINQVVQFMGGRMVWINTFLASQFMKGPYVAASGANYEMGIELTIPANNVLYAPYIMLGPVPAVNSMNMVSYQIYMDNVSVIAGQAAGAAIPIEMFAPPGAKVRLYIRTMATDAAITPTMFCVIPQILFDSTKDVWTWTAVAGAANPVDPSTLTWPA